MNEENTAPRKKEPTRHQLVIVLLLSFALMLLGSILGGLIVLPLNRLAGDRGELQFLLMYFNFIGIHIVVLLFCLIWEKPVLRSFRHARRGGGRGNSLGRFGLGLLLGFGMNGLCILLAWLHGDLDLSRGSFRGMYLLLAFFCVLVQSSAEELLTRGYMMGVLRQRYPAWVAVAANALFFGALHLFNQGITLLSFLNIVIIGLGFSLVMVYFDSLWLCAALHTAWNFTQNLIFGLPNSGIVSQASWFHLEGAAGSFCYDPVFGVEGSLTAVIVVGLFALGTLLLGRRRKAQS